MKTELQEIAQRWADGTISEADFAAIPNVERDAMLGDKELLWRRPCGEAIRAKKIDSGNGSGTASRTVSYVMSVEKGVGNTKDVVIQSGWDLEKFNKRGGPFLFCHNALEMRPPLGRMHNLKKNGKSTDGTKALTGDAEFTPDGVNPFNDMIFRMVDEWFMPGGSAGFRILSWRPPKTEAEIKKYSLSNNSYIIEAAELTEFSAVPIPMDPDATRRAEDLHQRVLRGVQTGEFGREQVDALRDAIGGMYGAAKRTTVSVPALPFDFVTSNAGGMTSVTIEQREEPRADGIQNQIELQEKPKSEPEVLALLIPLTVGTLADARAIVRGMGMSTRRVSERDGFWRFVQHDADGDVQSMTIDHKAGVRAEFGRARANEVPAMDDKLYGDLLTRVEALEAQNDELRERLDSITITTDGQDPAADEDGGESPTRSLYADVLGMTDEDFCVAFAGNSASTETQTK